MRWTTIGTESGAVLARPRLDYLHGLPPIYPLRQIFYEHRIRVFRANHLQNVSEIRVAENQALKGIGLFSLPPLEVPRHYHGSDSWRNVIEDAHVLADLAELAPGQHEVNFAAYDNSN
jgi:hypothetical protein